MSCPETRREGFFCFNLFSPKTKESEMFSYQTIQKEEGSAFLGSQLHSHTINENENFVAK